MAAVLSRIGTDGTVTAPDGVRLAVRDHGGEGPDVLLLHGRSRTLVDWGSVIDHLDGVRVASMDLRWHGRSDVGGAVSLDAWFGDIDAVTGALGMRRPVVVGHSLGGMLASQYGAVRDVAAAIDVDGLDPRASGQAGPPPPRDRGADHGGDDWYAEASERARRADTEFGVPPDIIERHIERTFVRDGDGTWHRRPPNALYEAAIGADARDYDDVLRSSRSPQVILLCTGAPKTPSFRDEPMRLARDAMLAMLRPLEAEVPGLNVHTIDGSHAVIWERPEEIASLIVSAR